jgi:hypothetical protein
MDHLSVRLYREPAGGGRKKRWREPSREAEVRAAEGWRGGVYD